ncbi:MAG: acetyl-CoA carboxylase biotin carboxyl carrier protein [Cyclobacteriaceae bacterium]
MKASEIQELLGFIAESGLDEVNIETSDIKLKVKKNTSAKIRQHFIQSTGSSMPADSTGLIAATPSYSMPQPQVAAETPAKSESSSKEDESRYVAIKSPMIGTFYRSPNPDADPFLQVGDTVKAGQAVCIIEAMKLFNEIESEYSGKVVKILAEDASPVEYDQPLFLIDPS